VGKKPGDLSHLVLLTIGHFYDLPSESLFKSQDRAVERMLRLNDQCAVDPDPDAQGEWPWPEEFARLYQNWPNSFLYHARSAPRAEQMCNRLCFMFGAPYFENNLASEVHFPTTIVQFEAGERKPDPGARIRCGGQERVLGSMILGDSGTDWGGKKAWGRLNLIGGPTFDYAAGEEVTLVGAGKLGVAKEVTPTGNDPGLLDLFGPIPLALFAQAAQNARRTNAALYGAPLDDRSLIGGPSRREFQQLSRITLITGTANTLWDPRCIDNMYDWLLPGAANTPDRFRKVKFEGYGHQDLLWGEDSSRKVFPDILRGLP
jgi:hypothetical protein